MKFLTLLTDAFGGRGGIAKYNRDLLAALSEFSNGAEVVALPRIVVDPITDIPSGVSFVASAAQGKLSYARHIFGSALANKYEAVVCAHINLLPLAAVAASLRRVPLVLSIHGIEAWTPPHRRLVRAFLPRLDAVASVSEFTKRRFAEWSGVALQKIRIIPNTIDLGRYRPGPRNPELVARFRLTDRVVVMTLGRLSASERYKGVDEVLESIPTLLEQIPNLTYLVVGDGDDRSRLEEKARSLGISNHVLFTGYVDERQKPDIYRLADAFVMPSRGEGFGIVFLEAIACGVPVIASTADASIEAIDYGRLGAAVDPSDQAGIATAIRRAVMSPSTVSRSDLQKYSYERFKERWHELLRHVTDGSAARHVAMTDVEGTGRTREIASRNAAVPAIQRLAPTQPLAGVDGGRGRQC